MHILAARCIRWVALRVDMPDDGVEVVPAPTSGTAAKQGNAMKDRIPAGYGASLSMVQVPSSCAV